jgi:hypothetical protein
VPDAEGEKPDTESTCGDVLAGDEALAMLKDTE